MKEKKLLLFMPSIEGGGVEKNFFIIANFFSKKINNLSIISTSISNKKKFSKNIELIFPKSFFWEKSSRRIKYFICLFLLIKTILFNKNLTVFAFQANLYCILVCKIFKINIITRSNSSPSGWSKNLFKIKIYKFFLQKADAVMVNSLEFKKQMKKIFGVNTTCIYNPLNRNDIISLSKKKTKNIFGKKKSLKIINIGRFVEQKDQETLIRALNLLKDKVNFQARIIGKGKLKNKLNNLINEYNLKNKVELINFTDNPFKYLVQADIFILTSAYEGLPNVLLEALSLKKFAISSDCPTGPKEILLYGNGGLLFKTGNYLKLSKQIIYYMQNKNKCKKMLEKSFRSLKRFDQKNNLEKYFNFVKKYI